MMHRERRQASRVWEQGKKAKPKATLDRTGSEQPSTIEDLEHERVRNKNKVKSQYHTQQQKAFQSKQLSIYISNFIRFFLLFYQTCNNYGYQLLWLSLHLLHKYKYLLILLFLFE
ncbi:Hypothetical_protein [Hexamita inflata]|uniref:Hypothetical_protein n=1 Tax=Hexamita inflata TaxID=28002 RepID=A0AA86U820_9EUKA|nr:Hypothetical protein HINF_LOCUS34350 [Hexamita inflata]